MATNLPPVEDFNKWHELAMIGIDSFFNNEFEKSEEYFKTHSETIPIFALCYSALAWFRAIMSMEEVDILEASTRISHTQKLCEKFMPPEGIASVIVSIKNIFSTSSSTSDETMRSKMVACESCVIFSEATLLSALISLFEESITSVLNAGLSIRSAWKYYSRVDADLDGCVTGISPGSSLIPSSSTNSSGVSELAGSASPTPAASAEGAVIQQPTELWKSILTEYFNHPLQQQRSSSKPDHVLAGLFFGIGAFNAIASVFPPFVLKLIAFFGFPHDRILGLTQLRHGLTFLSSPRMPLCALGICFMRIILPSFTSGDISEHADEARATLSIILDRYPNSALFLWLQGRFERSEKRPEDAIRCFTRCMELPFKWIQLKHLCIYELSWVHLFSFEWELALPLFQQLEEENNWSKSFYAYMQGVCLLHLGKVKEARIKFLKVLTLSSNLIRVGGKVIPAEQFALRRASEFVASTVFSEETKKTNGKELITLDIEAMKVIGYSFSNPVVVPDTTLEPGSVAHSLFLTYPLAVPGLEICYLFNGTVQMNEPALKKAIGLSTSVLNATLLAPYKDTSSSFLDACTSAVTQPSSNNNALMSTWPGSDKIPYEPPVDESADPQANSFLSGVFKSVRTSFRGINASPISISSPNSVISTFVRPSGISPIHAVSLHVLVQGTYYSSLGDLKRAEDCFRWIINLCDGKRNSIDSKLGSVIVSREKHFFAYAYYELGIIYEGLYKRAFKFGIEAVKGDLMKLHKRSISSVEKLAHYTRKYFIKARSVSGDYNWKLRLQIRVHLSLDALARTSENAIGYESPQQASSPIDLSPSAALKMAEDAFYATDDSGSAISPSGAGGEDDGDESD
jgi:tetratricopeptide (TPR) repeat protein